MIFTYSIISGFRAILGSIGVHVAMFFAMILFVRTPLEPYVNDNMPDSSDYFVISEENAQLNNLL